MPKQIDEAQLRQHDKNLQSAINFFMGLMVDPKTGNYAREDWKSLTRQLEMTYLEVMEAVIDQYRLPEDWE